MHLFRKNPAPLFDHPLNMAKPSIITCLIPVVSMSLLQISEAQVTEDFPIVADDLEVALFARNPLVRNPCAITFDTKGRLCVGMGPQYRAPKPDTPLDSVWIVTDEDEDGTR